MTRWVAKSIGGRYGHWGIVDTTTKKWVMVSPNERWHSTITGAQYCAEKWNRQGFQD